MKCENCGKETEMLFAAQMSGDSVNLCIPCMKGSTVRYFAFSVYKEKQEFFSTILRAANLIDCLRIVSNASSLQHIINTGDHFDIEETTEAVFESYLASLPLSE